MTTQRHTPASHSARTPRRSRPARRPAPQTTPARARTSRPPSTPATRPIMAPRPTSRTECAGTRTPRRPARLHRARVSPSASAPDGGGRVRTVHLDPALPLGRLLGPRARGLFRLLFLGLVAGGRWGRGRRGCGCAPGWWEEVDEAVGEERERRCAALVAAVERVREELHDRERQVVGWWQDVCCENSMVRIVL